MSSASVAIQIEFRYRHAIAFLESMRLEQVHLVGNSIGGLICCLIALREEVAFEVRSITLAAPFPFFEISANVTEKLAQHGQRLSTIAPNYESIRQLCLNTFGNPSLLTDEIVQLRLSMLQGRNWESYVARRPIARKFDRSRLGKGVITQPTFVIWGLADRSLPYEIGIAGMPYFTDADYLFLSGCGHWPQTETSQRFNYELINFLHLHSDYM